MANSFVQEGNVLNWYNGTGNAVASGAIVQVGFRGLGVALTDIASTATGSVMVDGVFELAKDTGDALLIGGQVWWDGTKCYNDVAANRWFIGTAAEAAGMTAATCKVKLGRFVEEGPRFLTLHVSTAAQAMTAADFMCGDLHLTGANTGAIEVDLPAVATIPKAFLRVVKTSNNSHAIGLDPAGSEVIAGGSAGDPYVGVDAQNDTAYFRSTGAAWLLINATLAQG
jgi:predicted RecA/RadA family phage recombinase